MEWRMIVGGLAALELGALMGGEVAAAGNGSTASRPAVTSGASSGPPAAVANANAQARPVAVEQEETVEGPFTVEQIDRGDRKVVVRGPDGNRMTVDVSPDATGFDKLRQGDQVQLDYYRADVVSVLPAAGAGQPPAAHGATQRTSAGTAAASATNMRAGLGSGTGGATTSTAGGHQPRQITAHAQVVSVDQQRGMMQVRTDDGRPQTLYLRGSQQEAMRGLKSGDDVVVTYVAPLTVAVRPVNR